MRARACASGSWEQASTWKASASYGFWTYGCATTCYFRLAPIGMAKFFIVDDLRSAFRSCTVSSASCPSRGHA